ncbi:MAG: N-acetyl-gamma-glutamyl-phosphate reductase [Endomicrobiales bacterium]|nr:N-acetyl-gamma-glutamyl-phosphate reductase [Endomicrobiales bacterium]
MKKIRAGIVGITGFTGEELIRLLVKHKGADITVLAGRSTSEIRPLKDIYPHFGSLDVPCEPLDPVSISKKCDVVFLALPHRVSFEIVPDLIKSNVKVIDLSADFRINNAASYEKWYGEKHAAPQFLPQAVYGLCELYRKEIKNARLVANPGCYPTTIILGLLPAIRNGLINLSSVIIDAKSSPSGAGRKSTAEYFEKEHPNFRPYNIGGRHRHIPEIEQELSKIAGEGVTVTFTPQIIPVERGMISTIYSNLLKKVSTEEITSLYRDFYSGDRFIRVIEENNLPDVRGVVNTNYCDITARIDERAGRLIVVSAIDNLVKGASGQAVQNMNIMFGLDETEGLI